MEIKNMVCGIGSGNIPKPGDPDNNSVFTATGTYGGITLKWTLPLTNAHAVAHYHIYRATANNVNQANRIATLNADTYFNAIPNNALNATYYYWLEVVTVNGTILPKIGPVEARALPEVERYLELLSNQIDQGLLSQSLNEKIAKLEGLEDGFHRQEQYIKNETGALATAIESVQVSLGDVSATVADVVKTQVSENEALAERISTAQAKLGDDIASTQVQMQSHITKTEDGLEKLGSLYTVKVDVNGLVGGFGVYNDGTTVEAGFNVDKFWVGRAGTKIKPFIIQDNTVYMNSAVIKDITFDKLKDATGQFVVQGGKIKAKYLEIPLITADMIDTRNLTIKDANGNVIFGAGKNIDVNRVSGLGTLAKQNTVGTNQVTGLGSLATKNNVNVAEVMGLGAFAKISKLDVNNINTYIGGAAIGEALIKNAAIKTAHIQDLAVDTIKIRDHAVTDIHELSFRRYITNNDKPKGYSEELGRYEFYTKTYLTTIMFFFPHLTVIPSGKGTTGDVRGQTRIRLELQVGNNTYPFYEKSSYYIHREAEGYNSCTTTTNNYGVPNTRCTFVEPIGSFDGAKAGGRNLNGRIFVVRGNNTLVRVILKLTAPFGNTNNDDWLTYEGILQTLMFKK